MSGRPDAVVLAGGRLHGAAARRAGEEVKAFARVGGRMLLELVVDALRESGVAGRIVVVGPLDCAQRGPAVDELVEASIDGAENVMRAVRAATSETALICSSDLPYICAPAVADFAARCAVDAAAAYPIYLRDDFLARFPAGRSAFAQLADGWWTGGSIGLVRPALIIAAEATVRAAFASRKNLAALASLFGPGLALKFLARSATVQDIERRASAMLGGPVHAVLGADPVLAFDCDDEQDFDYVRARE